MKKENRKLRTEFTFLIISFKLLCENKKTTNERKMMKMRKQKKMNNGNRKVRTEFATLIISSKSFCEMITAEREESDENEAPEKFDKKKVKMNSLLFNHLI